MKLYVLLLLAYFSFSSWPHSHGWQLKQLFDATCSWRCLVQAAYRQDLLYWLPISAGVGHIRICWLVGWLAEFNVAYWHNTDSATHVMSTGQVSHDSPPGEKNRSWNFMKIADSLQQINPVDDNLCFSRCDLHRNVARRKVYASNTQYDMKWMYHNFVSFIPQILLSPPLSLQDISVAYTVYFPYFYIPWK